MKTSPRNVGRLVASPVVVGQTRRKFNEVPILETTSTHDDNHANVPLGRVHVQQFAMPPTVWIQLTTEVLRYATRCPCEGAITALRQTTASRPNLHPLQWVFFSEREHATELLERLGQEQVVPLRVKDSKVDVATTKGLGRRWSPPRRPFDSTCHGPDGFDCPFVGGDFVASPADHPILHDTNSQVHGRQERRWQWASTRRGDYRERLHVRDGNDTGKCRHLDASCRNWWASSRRRPPHPSLPLAMGTFPERGGCQVLFKRQDSGSWA
ncbi:hypothetical protein H310_10277 [Aphanomyces invadans]|uniref:Uncharacterized protein n=1 Tax=Aphanomyces invadans TaxID=157072 RepID=A0A024TQY9_9STRA|nr:hypothetical protein H310_10277 [Aphanomyces invadans]ETV96575.1 hypothetical protein H310_10277 [Aphanomyces invadans]|eukprot:XP_008874838.1 hypothetical protein H310_10277 [Aphanomyces invadans]